MRFEHRDEAGDYLDTRWMAHLTGHRLLLIPNHLATVRRTLAGLPLAAILLTGGNDLSGAPGGTDLAPERDETEGWLLDHAQRHQVPVIGVCRGAQALAVRAGARVADGRLRHAGTRHRVHTVAQTPWEWPDTFTVSSHHRYILPAAGLPDELRVLALADGDSTVEAFVHRRLPWWGLMWHPEREDPPGPAARALHHLLHHQATRPV
ncbi:gamma-glutamyl-gamma-aminobutyrate hydrolase family protein [Streptomyces sp. NPDC002680]|uniref:gamma-glutamyl-gamma-aminobutyrate hydrolase family protein n=1 Tax=Streptomyces sp. NPDC002680 TaxID=3364659 RepID=UPI00367BCAE1